MYFQKLNKESEILLPIIVVYSIIPLLWPSNNKKDWFIRKKPIFARNSKNRCFFVSLFLF